MNQVTPLLASFYLCVALWAYWLISAFFTHRTKFQESSLQRLLHGVPLYIAFYLVFHRHGHVFLFGELYKTGWDNWIVYPGLAFTSLGIAIAVWARIHLGRYWSGTITLKEGHKVIDTGPYAFVRHPIYTGWLLMLFGSALCAGTADGFVGVELLILAFVVKLHWEERLLTKELGDEYVQYSERVSGAIIPISNSHKQQGPRSIASEAFNNAALQSDRYRAMGIICICGAFVAYEIFGAFINSNPDRSFGPAIVWWTALAIYEFILLRITIHAEWRGHQARPWVWGITTAIECLLPTSALLGLTAEKDYIGPYRALVSSAVGIYFLFIILSTLRLNPWICIIAGLSSSLGYLSLFIFTLHVAPTNKYRHVMPDATFINYCIYLFGAGIVAAAVARQIRQHVMAALAEAETKRKLDRVEHDLNVARTIQMGLLPKKSPTVPGFDVAGWSKPADQTGGDYYDWLELPGGKIMFTVADAAGHGIGPALLVAACRAYFRAIAGRNDPLESMTNQVDVLVSADIPDGRFITAAVALLDAGADSLSLYSAGHAPMFRYVNATDKIEILDADQPPLGTLFGGDGAVARDVKFAPGDALILVTDGFFEYRNVAGELLGAGPLGEMIRKNKALSAKDMIHVMYQDVLAYAGGTPQADDLTAVIIKKQPVETV